MWLAEKPSLRAASCCSVDVVNGAGGLRLTGFVSTLYTTAAPERVPIMVVCGTQEENLANNRALATHLAATHDEIGWGEVPDGHTWTTWRDLLDPHLTRLLTEAWR